MISNESSQSQQNQNGNSAEIIDNDNAVDDG